MAGVRDIVSDHPAVDQIPAVAALGIYLGQHAAGAHLVRFPDWPTITTFHQTLLEAVAALFGIVFTAVAILRALGPGARLNHLRRRLSRQATQNLMSVVTALGIATLVCVVAMALDTSTGRPTFARAITVWALALVVVRMVRLVWYFSLVLDLSDRDAETAATEAGDPPRRSSIFRRRAS